MKKLTILGPIIILILWLVVGHLSLIDEFFLPKPEKVAIAIWVSFASKNLLADVEQTCLRWFAGLVIGIMIGIPIGIAMGASRRIYNLLEVVMEFFRSIPTITLFPLFLVFFGIGNTSKIFIAAWATVLYVFINTLYGVRHSRESRLKVAKVFRATKRQTFIKVIIPDALPSIFVGIRIALSMSLVVVVASEMIMGTELGLGRRIYDSALVFAIPEMYAAIIITGLLGYLSNKLFVIGESNLIHWGNK
jgi:NitT/TauT family transport system permease protein